MAEGNSPILRNVLDAIAPYRPGRRVVGPAGQSYKLSSNESPYGPLPSVREAIAAASGEVNRYPDSGAGDLVAAIARRFDVPADHVAVGAGSVGVAVQLLEAVAEPGSEVVYAWRSFEAYPLLADLSGATSVRVPLHRETHDLDALADAVTDRTRLVFVCNPNNPTGTTVREAELRAFLGRIPDHVLVVLDEAYREYVRDPGVPDGLTLYPEHTNVAVLRTFSKAYGLAGLRVGFLIGPPPIAEAVTKTMTPFAVNHIAQAAAVASLDAESELLARVDDTVVERDRVRHQLITQGWTVPESQANFVWLRLGADTTDFAETCAMHGVAVRPFPGEGVRVSIGIREENDAFLAAAETFPARH